MSAECSVCGTIGARMSVRLAEYVDPSPRRFDTLLRCVDEAACLERVLGQGLKWPLTTTTGIAPIIKKHTPRRA